MAVEAEDSAGAAADFLVDMGLAAVERFVAEAAGSPAAVLSAVAPAAVLSAVAPAGVLSVVAPAGVHFAVAATSDVVTAVFVGAVGTDVGTGVATGLYSASVTVIRIIGPTITMLIIPIPITLIRIPTLMIRTPMIPTLTAIRVTAMIRMANIEVRKRVR